ncbi:putative RNA 3'-terminal phosphate cyclase-like protein isoform X2 [Lycorma delicatula]|uniref:putative RNA 3'-terminal phosphate cyclase-like protein isoform X1 n=1 Tax=Lycorma delicatula TaxID=130591 RepID=UPI003F5132C8
MAADNSNVLCFKGSNYMRQRLLLSVVSGKAIRITDIRTRDDEPGLKEYEVNLLRLLDKMSNGTWLEVNETGTAFSFTPGSLIGGSLIHECCRLRGIGYYLEVILALAPFCKKSLNITLRGVTNNQKDPSVDAFKNGALAVLRRFMVVDPGLELIIKKRGMEPQGGGEVTLNCPNIKQLKPIMLKDWGKMKRVRGTMFALRVSPALSNRMVEAAKGVFLQFIPDVFFTVDHLKGQCAGKSPGFGASIYAETTTDVFYTSDKVSNPPTEKHSVPEDVGKEAAWALLDEISGGGCIDSAFQSLCCLYMALTTKDVSQCVIGPLSPYTIEFLRHLRKFFGLIFKLEPFKNEENVDVDDNELQLGVAKVLLTCVGVGYQKLS